VSKARAAACFGYFLLIVPFSPAVIAGYLLAGLSWLFLNSKLSKRIFLVTGIYFVSVSALLTATYLLTRVLQPVKTLSYLYEQVAMGVSHIIVLAWLIKLCLEAVAFRICGKELLSRLFKVAGIISIISLLAILVGYIALDFKYEFVQSLSEVVFATGLILALVNNIIAGIAFIKAKIPSQKTALNIAEEMSYQNVCVEDSASDKGAGSTWVYS